MGRTRAASLDGARRVLTEHGVRKATMGDVAVRGGLAKATLYNHFRTKDELLSALVSQDLAELAADCVDLAADDLVVALTRAADAIAMHSVLVALREVEPVALLPLASPSASVSWDEARVGVAAVLDVVVRWLASYVLEPGSAATRSTGARVLAGGLPIAVRTTSFAAPAEAGAPTV